MARTDAVTMLKDDHKTVEQLFKRFEKTSERAHVERRNIVDRIVEELAVHSAIEEQVFYPVARATVPSTEAITLESLEEHHIVKWVLSELDSMSPQDERFEPKVTVLIENVRHHIKEEEQDLFPKVRKELGRDSLNDVGEAMAKARDMVPTHPHPRSPDTPPGNFVMGAASGVADRIGDTVSGIAQGSVTAAGDIIATILGRKKPRVTPRGSRAARDTAKRVRAGAGGATDSAIEAILTAREAGERTLTRARKAGSSARSGARSTARSTKRGATSTARAAKSGAKGIGTSARGGSGRTATTARRAATTTAKRGRAAAKSTTSTAKRSVGQTRSAARRTSR